MAPSFTLERAFELGCEGCIEQEFASVLYKSADLPGYTYPSMWKLAKPAGSLIVIGKPIFSVDLIAFLCAWTCISTSVLVLISSKRPDVPIAPFVAVCVLTFFATIGLCAFTRAGHSGRIVLSVDPIRGIIKLPVWKGGSLQRLDGYSMNGSHPKATISLRIPEEAVVCRVKGTPVTSSKGDPRGMQLDITVTTEQGVEKTYPVLFEATLKRIEKELAQLGVPVSHL